VALEGALKLKEISYIHAEGYPAAEMKHGPIALIDDEMPVVVVATKNVLYEKVVSNIQEIKARKEALEADIKMAMGDAEAMVTPDDTVLATWKAPKPSAKFNGKKLQAEMPDLYAQYCQEEQGARRFLLK
jgi:glucosamine 6-phosphate synthetase-like amidotransferase/phosphosugar isomerase protein